MAGSTFFVNFPPIFLVIIGSYVPVKLAFFVAKNGFLGHFSPVLEEV